MQVRTQTGCVFPGTHPAAEADDAYNLLGGDPQPSTLNQQLTTSSLGLDVIPWSNRFFHRVTDFLQQYFRHFGEINFKFHPVSGFCVVLTHRTLL